MHRPLHEHILFLETKLRDLRDKVTDDNLSRDTRAAILTQIRFAIEAIALYRQAFEAEYAAATGDLSKPITESRSRIVESTPDINPPEEGADLPAHHAQDTASESNPQHE